MAAYKNFSLGSRVDSKAVIWVREFLFGHLQRVRVGRQLSEEVRVMSGVPQGSVLGPLLFFVYINNIWRNLESNIKLVTDDCIIYRKIMNDSDIDTLQIDVDRLGDWAVENLIKINPGKSKAERSGEGASKLYFWGPKNSRSKQLRIFRNNLMQRFKQG